MKQKIINILLITSGILAVIQGFLPMMPIPKPDIVTVSAILMFLVSTTTIWKETLLQIVDKTKMYSAISLAILATIGGINHLMDKVHIPDNVGQWIRFGITAVTAGLNSGSIKAIFFPDDSSIEKTPVNQ
jgi:hypothetical protein